MELNERDMIIQIEQQLKNSVNNQTQIMSNLKEIFGRIEGDSKKLVSLYSEFRGYIDNSRYRWDETKKEIENIYRKIEENEKNINRKIEENEKSIYIEKESRSLFEQNIKSTISTILWVFGALATLATIISGITLVLNFLEKI
jgi:hypothetical protein